MKWSGKDPRWIIGKRADIIIIDSNVKTVYSAHVDVKETYCIFVKRPTLGAKDFLSADDDWPVGWYWTQYPSLDYLKKIDKEEV
jgi:hypothetical protein